MRATHLVLTAICAFVITGPVRADCPVIDAAESTKAITAKPEFRDGANAQVARDLRILRDAAVVLDAYDQDSACKRVVGALNRLASHPERALEAGDTDEGKAEAVQKARKPNSAKP
jgi:hypothetical protein